MKCILEQRTEEKKLYHVTACSNFGNIFERGILPSVYGDLEVNGNDGKGVYAFTTKPESEKYAKEFAMLSGEEACIIEFMWGGKGKAWFECVDVRYSQEEKEEGCATYDHIGYIVIPNRKIPITQLSCAWFLWKK